MSLVFNTKTYTADSFQKDIVSYNGANRTVSVRDDLRLARTAPKASDTFSGVGRTQAKLTRTLTLTGAKTATGDCFGDVNCSVPVGAASADIDALLNDLGALISSASFKDFVKKQQINF